jgi:hypothetical protein
VFLMLGQTLELCIAPFFQAISGKQLTPWGQTSRLFFMCLGFQNRKIVSKFPSLSFDTFKTLNCIFLRKLGMPSMFHGADTRGPVACWAAAAVQSVQSYWSYGAAQSFSLPSERAPPPVQSAIS